MRVFRTLLMLLGGLGIWVVSYAQKTGVGTNSPQARFHIYVPDSWTDSIFIIQKDTLYMLVVTQSGKVSIGTNKPQYNLDAFGKLKVSTLAGSQINLVIVKSDGTLDTLFIPGDSTKVLLGNLSWGSYPGGATNDTLWADAGPYIYPIISNFDTIAINDSGWLGIATFNPQVPLHLDGAYWWFNGTNQNILIGYGVGQSITTGRRNVLLGDSAGFSLQDGAHNTFVGSGAGSGTTSGIANTAIGFHAMYKGSGSNSVAVGSYAMGSGGSTAAYRYSTLAIGYKSLFRCNSCQHNISIGMSAGENLQNGSRNIIIGNSALATHSNVSGTVAIGNEALTSQESGLFISPQVAVGHYSMASDGVGTGNTSVGNLSFNGSVKTIFSTGIGFSVASNTDSLWYVTVIGTDALDGSFALIRDVVVAGSYAFNKGAFINSIALGSSAGGNITNGAINSVFVGPEAGYNLQGITRRSIVVGSFAGRSATGDVEDVVAIGDSALLNPTSVNIAIGKNAMQNNTGSRNIAIGYAAMKDAISATKNIAIGSEALSMLQNDSLNIAIGLSVLRDLKKGNKNVFVGYLAGYKIDSSYNTVAIGSQVFQEKTNVRDIIAIGSRAMQSVSAASGDFLQSNIAIGYKAIGSSTGIPVRNVAIGAFALEYGRKNFNIAIGTEAQQNCKWCSYNIGIGARTLNNDTISTHNIALGYGTMGLGQPGDSNIAVGYGALNQVYGKGNIALGYLSMAGTDVRSDNNISIGSFAMSYTGSPITGGNNIAVGTRALSGISSGSDNIAFGYKALGSLTTGSRNIGVGAEAMLLGQTSQDNIAIGSDALRSDTGSIANIAVGYLALSGSTNTGNYNVAIGGGAMKNGGSGNYNIFLGFLAPDSLAVINGNYNVGIGFRTFSGITGSSTASYNTAVGVEAGPVGNFDNTSAFGYQAQPTASNRIHIGNNQIVLVTIPTTWSTYSDKRFKTNIREDVKGLDFIIRLRPVTYVKNPIAQDKILYGRYANEDSVMQQALKYISQYRYSGFIAQEVDSVARLIGYDFSGVRTPNDVGGDGKAYTISYADFVVPLVKAVQEQQALIEQQEIVITENEKILRELEALDRQLQDLIDHKVKNENVQGQ